MNFTTKDIELGPTPLKRAQRALMWHAMGLPVEWKVVGKPGWCKANFDYWIPKDWDCGRFNFRIKP